MTLSPGFRLGPYEILAPLGAGGMGEVYRARDRKLDRNVAIKVLPEHLSESVDLRQRFEREAKAVAALSHPNILAIHDFGSQDEITYAVMELLEGQTLRERLEAGPVSQERAMDYAVQVAKGLSAAHEKGIVHRDLKPENLFVTKDGRVKILDFGLVKRVVAVGPEEAPYATTVPAPTAPGTVMGTVGYMSPEQVRGTPADARSDIFSFGAILYEMLSGVRAFRGDSAADTMSAILNDEPPELAESGSRISPALERIVRHCLEKDRDNRFQTAKDIAFALSEQSSTAVKSGARPATPRNGKMKVLLATFAVIALAVASIFVLQRTHSAAADAGRIKRLAVLPFENLGAPEADYFADGMADEVRGKLTTLAGLQVIARASSLAYKKVAKSPKQIADELGVSYLLTATVRWEKSDATSRVHVSPELVKISSSTAPISKWQQPFDAQMTDVFQVQSDIATRVARALGVALGTVQERRLSEKPTQNLAAYDAFLKGEEAANDLAANDSPSLRKALGFYEQAVALDPGFAQAWAQLSRANSLLYVVSVPSSALAESARQAGEKAVELAPDQAEGYLALGNYQNFILNDRNHALEQYARGRRLAPDNADLLSSAAVTERNLGRWEAAVEHLHRAEQLDPRSVLTQHWLGDALLWLRRYSESRRVLDRGLSLAPANLYMIERKAMTFLGEGDLSKARAVLEAARKVVEPTSLIAYTAFTYDLVWLLDEQQRELLARLTPDAFDDDKADWGLCLSQAYALKGDAAKMQTYAEEARKTLSEQLRATPEDGQRHVLLGLALAYLGRREEATREGRRGVALLPVAKHAYFGPYYQHQLARIYILVGEPEKALDQLEPLLKIPYLLSPGWLRINPNFDPLRKNSRFQKLVAGAM